MGFVGNLKRGNAATAGAAQARKRGTVVRPGDKGVTEYELRNLAPSMALGFYVASRDEAVALRRALLGG